MGLTLLLESLSETAGQYQSLDSIGCAVPVQGDTFFVEIRSLDFERAATGGLSSLAGRVAVRDKDWNSGDTKSLASESMKMLNPDPAKVR
jgi:hypothetical protein